VEVNSIQRLFTTYRYYLFPFCFIQIIFRFLDNIYYLAMIQHASFLTWPSSTCGIGHVADFLRIQISQTPW
jgi:hypothetical protein